MVIGGMATTMAYVYYVPLILVPLLFQLANDYKILLLLMGAVGLARWMLSVANQCKEGEGPNGEHDMKLCIMGVGDNHQP
ncbi:putative chloride channel, core [Helianthus anomalus]